MNPMRRHAVAFLCLASLGCSKENSVDASTHVEGVAGAQCSGDNDPACGTSAVCVYGFCRLGCTDDASCPTGSLCVGDKLPFGCTLKEEVTCDDKTPCKSTSLSCGLDGTCRIPCSGTKACPRNDQRCIAGACVGESEKTQGALAMLGCEEGKKRCGSSDAPCNELVCKVEACNTTGPGWASTPDCTSDAPFCASGGSCIGVALRAPASLVTVQAPNATSYGIDAHEVTRAEYARFLHDRDANATPGSEHASCSGNASYVPICQWPPTDRPDDPVVCVDWCDAYAYCKWADKRLCGDIGGGPVDHAKGATTASQWFNACSSGGNLAYPYSDTYSSSACRGDGFGAPTAVESLATCQSSEQGFAGIFDMSGNVAEWEDACDGNNMCDVRGGAFAMQLTSPQMLSCADQVWSGPYKRTDDPVPRTDIGFRCCKGP